MSIMLNRESRILLIWVVETMVMSSSANAKTTLCNLERRTERRCSSRRELSQERVARTHQLERLTRAKSLNTKLL
jgi:hypothetical protein